MEQPKPPAAPASADPPAPDRDDPAVQAMLRGIEALDALKLEGVEPAAAFLWT